MLKHMDSLLLYVCVFIILVHRIPQKSVKIWIHVINNTGQQDEIWSHMHINVLRTLDGKYKHGAN